MISAVRILGATTVLPIVLLAACSTSGTPTANEPSVADRPELLGTTESDFEESGPLERLFSGSSKETDAKLEAAEARIARLEREIQEQQLASEQTSPLPVAAAAPAPEAPVPKLAVVFGATVDHVLASGVAEVTQQRAQLQPLTLAQQDAVQSQLQALGCAGADCLSKLAQYPGARIVTQFDKIASSDPNRLRFALVTTDTLLGKSYPALELAVPAVDGRPTRPALEALADYVLISALRKSQVAPWSTRVFSQEGPTLHLAAGERSGLKVGDVLEARGPGKVVMAPGGVPAGWVPGEVKGELRITGLFGYDFATAEVIRGLAPSPDAVLTLKSRQ
jgi:hypothetical protein